MYVSSGVIGLELTTYRSGLLHHALLQLVVLLQFFQLSLISTES